MGFVIERITVSILFNNPPNNTGSKRIVLNLLEYNNELMLVIAIDLEDYMGQYGIVWNRGVVEVAGIEPASY